MFIRDEGFSRCVTPRDKMVSGVHTCAAEKYRNSPEGSLEAFIVYLKVFPTFSLTDSSLKKCSCPQVCTSQIPVKAKKKHEI